MARFFLATKTLKTRSDRFWQWGARGSLFVARKWRAAGRDSKLDPRQKTQGRKFL